MGDVKISSRVNKIILCVILLLAFLIRYYPHMVLIDNVGLEEGNMIYYAESFAMGDTSSINNLPHGSIVLAIVLYRVFGFTMPTSCYLVAPLLGVLSTYLVYSIVKRNGSIGDALVAGGLFAFLDVSVYRSSSFGASGESLGIFLLLLTIRLYLSYGKWAYVGIFPIAFVHIIVFVVASSWVICGYLYEKYTQGKINVKKTILLIVGIGVIGGVFLFLGPHRLAVVNILARGGFFDVSAITRTLVTRMIPQLFSICLGSTLLYVFLAYYVYKNKVNLLSLLIVTTGLIFIGFFVFSSSHISPYRIMPYLSILSIFAIASKKIKNRELMVLILIVIMGTQALTNGFETTLYVNESTTRSELEASYWLREYDPTVVYYKVFTDDMGKQMLLYYCPMPKINATIISKEEVETEKNSWGMVMNTSKTVITGKIDPNMNETSYMRGFKYILYSERLANRALYMADDGVNQFVYVKTTVPDVWKDSQYWTQIYGKDDVIIYEKVNK